MNGLAAITFNTIIRHIFLSLAETLTNTPIMRSIKEINEFASRNKINYRTLNISIIISVFSQTVCEMAGFR